MGEGRDVCLSICPFGEFSAYFEDNFITQAIEETKLLFSDLM